MLLPVREGLSFVPQVASALGVSLKGPGPEVLQRFYEVASTKLTELLAVGALQKDQRATVRKFLKNPEDPTIHWPTLRQVLGKHVPLRVRDELAVQGVGLSTKPWVPSPWMSWSADHPRTPVTTDTLVEAMRARGARNPITDVLVWNDGMSQGRLVDGCRALSARLTGDPHALQVTTVLSDDGVEAGYRSLGDHVMRIHGLIAKETFLDLDKFRQALRLFREQVSRERGAQARPAVAVGWGYLAENAQAREIANEEGVVFLGPPAESIRRGGDKAAAKEVARQENVPVVPGSEGALSGVDEALRLAACHYPILLKALAGGGGKGIREVKTPDEMPEAYESATREAAKAFNNGALLLEKKINKPRHIEIQVLVDEYGDGIALGERECSLQRRFQKRMESGAHHTVPLETLREMRVAAVRYAVAMGYRNLGTVEFLYEETTGAFFLMEMNTRLQVEHPVTEQQTGLDLVTLQLAVAMGVPLDELIDPGLRDRMENGLPDCFTLAVRIQAEDGWSGMGSAGLVKRLKLPQNIPGLRTYFSVQEGSRVTGRGDAQIGHVFVTAATYEEAVSRMRLVLNGMEVDGIHTNLDFLRALLASEQVTTNRGLHTRFLDDEFISQHDAVAGPPEQSAIALVAMAIHQYDAQVERLRRGVVDGYRRGVIPPPADPWQTIHLTHEGRIYDVRVTSDQAGSYFLELGGPTLVVEVIAQELGRFKIIQGDEVFAVEVAGNLVSLGGSRYSFLSGNPNQFPSPTPGKLLKWLVVPGQPVSKGQKICVIEFKKEEQEVLSPRDGVVAKLLLSTEVTVDAGQPLLEFAAGDELRPTGPQLAWSSTSKAEDPKALCSHYLAGLVELPGVEDPGREGLDALLVPDAIKDWLREPGLGGNRFFAKTFPLVQEFWRREQAGLNPKGQDEKTLWSYHLARATLESRVKLIVWIVGLYRPSMLRELDEAERKQVAELLGSMATITDHPEYDELRLQARRLREALRPQEAPDVREVLGQAVGDATGVGGEEALESLRTYPGSLATSLVGLLSPGMDAVVSRLAARLLVERTYLQYRLVASNYLSGSGEESDLIAFSFDDGRNHSLRYGVGLHLVSGGSLQDGLRGAHRNLVARRAQEDSTDLSRDVIEVALQQPRDQSLEDLKTTTRAALQGAISERLPKRVTFMVAPEDGSKPYFIDWRTNADGRWPEQPLVQSYHPIDGEAVELWRFEPFRLDLERTPDGVFVIKAVPKTGEAGDTRLSVRTTIPATRVLPGPSLPELEEAFEHCLDRLVVLQLEEVAGNSNGGAKKAIPMRTILLNIEAPISIRYQEIDAVIRAIADKHRSQYRDVKLRTVEVVLKVVDDQDAEGRGYKEVLVRISNPTERDLKIRTSVVTREDVEDGTVLMVLVDLNAFLSKRKDPDYKIPRDAIYRRRPYTVLSPLERRIRDEDDRGVTYVYEVPNVHRRILEERWLAAGKSMPPDAFQVREFLPADPDGPYEGIEWVDRPAGQNKLAAVAWEVTVRFPDEITPRRYILCSGDQTVKNGSADRPEDVLFAVAGDRALAEGIPFYPRYAGSGARMEPNDKIGPALVHDRENGRLLLPEAQWEALKGEVIDGGESVPWEDGVYRVVRELRSVNQSALSGSGLKIAFAIDTASEDGVPTFAAVMGKEATGKEAYAWQMAGQRVQRDGATVILSGARAINAGKQAEAYADESQVGPAVVHAQSGSTHAIVDDEEAVTRRFFEWLRYQTEQKRPRDPGTIRRRPPLPADPQKLWLTELPDGIQDWDVAQQLLEGEEPLLVPRGHGSDPYDPRELVRRIVDDGDYQESGPDYAPHVVTLRAKMGGRSVGVLCFDPRSIQTVYFMDAAEPKDEEARRKVWPGRTWSPQGARKSADFVREIDAEGQDLLIIPNLRGFLGDPTAFLQGVLKEGAEIPKALRAFGRRVVIWMPPYADLRGGAEVVIDPEINPNIVFFMDPRATMGVLEPEMQFALPKPKRLVEAESLKMLQKDDRASGLGAEAMKVIIGQVDFTKVPKSEDIEKILRAKQIDLRYVEPVRDAALKARDKWVAVLWAQDGAHAAVKQGRLHAVIPTKHARRAIVNALQSPLV